MAAYFFMSKEGTDFAAAIQLHRSLDCRMYPVHAKILQSTRVPHMDVSHSQNHDMVNGG